jgi:hypothetical protein
MDCSLFPQQGKRRIGWAGGTVFTHWEGAKMLPITSNAIRYTEHEAGQVRSSHPGMLGRLFLKFRPPWHADYFFQKPRRSIDRDLQERWPIDLL